MANFQTQASSAPWLNGAVELGIGTWAWGDRLMWGFGGDYATDDVRAAFDATLAAGIALFDTAEVYGFGQSERLLGQFIRERASGDGPQPLIATKFAPLPWRFSGPQLIAALRGSLERLGAEQVALYQVHFPVPLPPIPEEVWAAALADALDLGLTRAVGVSNYNRERTIRAHYVLARRGHALATNQVEYSLLERSIERDGTLDAARELGVTIIAYSPLGMGLLTGKYTAENPPPGPRGARYRQLLPKLPPLISALTEIGAAHGDKSPAQVALNWTICKGTLPIPGAKNAKQAEHNAGAVGWRLTADEVAQLDEISAALA
ncbi:MAG: aldo/keto reductase [Chloroflexi bacterium]|nr:aldo/keto reductase [Chloroflexota bacterium]